ncbi:MAG: phosphatidate cytidylyltransferase [Rikenellaceae bacterium]
MIRTIYFVILVYFLLGGVAFYFINRRKEPGDARKNRIKFSTYFLIINILFFSIVINPIAFRQLALVIIIAGFYELFKLFRKSGYNRKGLFLLSAFLFAVLSFGFFFFSGMKKELILFSFIILSIFDSFSQITGQLWGRKKLCPKISPNKTVEGFTGGALVAILSALLIKSLIAAPSLEAMLLAAGVVLFAFTGDISASYYKRKYNAKDFSNFIPGHGGFLDRFDSLVAVGAWIAFIGSLINI